MLSTYISASDTASMLTNYINAIDTASMLSTYFNRGDTIPVTNGGTGLTTFGGAGRVPYSTGATGLAFDTLFRVFPASGNFFYGENSGAANTTGVNNTYIGRNTGRYNTTGSFNLFLGLSAGANNTTGGTNQFIGNSAGSSNTTGSNNFFLGSSSGTSNTTGSSNTFIGSSSGRSNTTGNTNIFIGRLAGYNTSDTLSGSSNIGIGALIADNIRFGASKNIAIGDSIDLPISDGSGQLVVGNLLFGTGITGTGTTIPTAGKVGIKVASPTRDFHVAGEMRVADLDSDVTPTRIVGADATGVFDTVGIGTGLSISGGTLNGIDTTSLSNRIDTKLNASDTSKYVKYADTLTTIATKANLALKLNAADTASLSNRIDAKQNTLVNSAGLAAALSDETGTGLSVFNTSPTFLTSTIINNTSAAPQDNTGSIILSRNGSSRWSILGLDATNSDNNLAILNNANTLDRPFVIKRSNNYIGIGTGSPVRTLHVAGDVRITDLFSDAPTRIVGADNDGDLSELIIGTGLSINANTLNTSGVADVYIPINVFAPGDTVTNVNASKNFFLVHSALNGHCIDSYTVKSFAGTGSADVQLDINGVFWDAQSISGTTTYTKDSNRQISSGQYIRTNVFNVSGTLVGLGVTLKISETCN